VKAAGITPESAAIEMIPANYVKLEGQQARTMFRLMEAMEDYDDVQNVYTNADIDQKDLEEVAG
jgi:transcriptional/translational regulatory protein YebC/TACO1